MRRLTVLATVLSAIALAPPAGAAPRAESPAPEAAVLRDPVPCVGCWQPPLVTSWQWQLQGNVDTSLDVDMFDIDGFEATKSLVQAIHSKGAAAVCYVDAGSWEDWRSDADDFPQRVLGRSNGWPGERWLDVRAMKVLRPIMRARIEMCANKGFDGVEFDLVDGYLNNTGFPLTGADQLRYDVWLANTAHSYGMSAALKNDLPQIATLLDYFDYSVNEQCFQYHECANLDLFVGAGKAVFQVEYKLDTSDFCPKANARNYNSLKKELSLRVWRVACR